MESYGLEDVPHSLEVKHNILMDREWKRDFIAERWPSMKELVTSDSRPIPEAYENVAIALHPQHPVAASTLPTQTSLKSTFLRGRRFIYPPLPVAIDNLHNIPDVFSNIGEDRSLLSSNTLNEGQYGLLVFCTNDGLC